MVIFEENSFFCFYLEEKWKKVLLITGKFLAIETIQVRVRAKFYWKESREENKSVLNLIEGAAWKPDFELLFGGCVSVCESGGPGAISGLPAGP